MKANNSASLIKHQASSFIEPKQSLKKSALALKKHANTEIVPPLRETTGHKTNENARLGIRGEDEESERSENGKSANASPANHDPKHEQDTTLLKSRQMTKAASLEPVSDPLLTGRSSQS